MIKKYWQITVRDYDIMERTGRFNHLCKLPFLTRFFEKKIAKEIEILQSHLNGLDSEQEIRFSNDYWQLETEIQIAQLRIAYYGLLNSVGLSGKLTNLQLIYSQFIKKRKVKRTPKSEPYIEMAKKYAKIDVKEYKDIDRVGKYLQFRIDKYHQHFGKKRSQEKTYLMAIVLGVVSFLNINFNPDMTVIEFIEAKKRAEKNINKHGRDNANISKGRSR